MASKRSRQAFEADLQKQESPYVIYGTPLPPLDAHVRDDGSFVPIWKQEVTDDRGRKRLHGAFTGGFSAGYYNTVGSKEGWTPSTFVSSRQNRMKDSKMVQQTRAEDFMDEEDLRDAEESRQLQTSDTFSGFGTEHDGSRRDALIDLFRPPGEPVGIKLLKVMGWTGQEHQSNSNGLPDSDSHYSTFVQKYDSRGLGFEADSGASLRDGTDKAGVKHERDEAAHEFAGMRTTSQVTRKPKPTKSAFGVGVLNDTGSDDEDPYSMGPQISYNRSVEGGKMQKKKATSAVNAANPAPGLKTRPVYLSKKLANLQGILAKCHDGRLPLEGFVLGDSLETMAALSLQGEQYKPPEVPPGWILGLLSETQQQEAVALATDSVPKPHDAKTRATVLGEKQLPGKSVFDFLSPAARDRLVQTSGRTSLPPGLGEKAQDVAETSKSQTGVDIRDLIPRLDGDVALQALSRGGGGWMPYGEDEAKRLRYREYLEIFAGLRGGGGRSELPRRVGGMTQDNWIMELHEFARAAQVFKPVTGEMASRFTSSTLNVPSSANADSSLNAESLLSRPKAKPEDPAVAAARMGMFGPLTRSTSNFYPSRLLCKRFNVQMPEHGPLPQQAEVGQFTPELVVEHNNLHFQSGGYQDDEPADPTKRVPTTPQTQNDKSARGQDGVRRANLEDSAIDLETNEALEKDKPSQALFKAIFGSDEEDE